MAFDELDELSAGIPDDIGDDENHDVVENQDDVTDVANLDDLQPAAPESDNDDDAADDGKNDVSNLSGIEQYLSQFNIEGGIIDFQDGTRSHFNELAPEKQVEILTKLHNESSAAIEEKYGLTEEEIGLVNYMRQQGGSINDIINDMALQRANTYIASKTAVQTDIDKLDDDAIYTSFLMNSNPQATVEQLEEDLETAKKMSNFQNVVSNLRNSMKKEQADLISSQKQAQYEELRSEIEDQRKQVVEVVSKMSDIDGLAINDGIKNDVLDMILNVDEDGDSLFMTEVFSDPAKLFKAAFWYKNGQDIVNAREEYWKKEKSAAYKRGQTDNTGKRTFTANDVNAKNATTPHRYDPTEIVGFDDLY